MSYFFIPFLMRRHAFYKQFGSGDTISFLMRRHHFIKNWGQEAPFYWLFERGGANLLGKFWRRLVEFFIYIQNYAGGWPEFHFMAHALPGGLVI